MTPHYKVIFLCFEIEMLPLMLPFKFSSFLSLKKVSPTYYLALSPRHSVANSTLNKYFRICLQVQLSFWGQIGWIIVQRRRELRWVQCLQGGVYDSGSVALTEGSSAISKRAWGILEKHFRDWAARICVSAGGQRFEALTPARKNSIFLFCASHPAWAPVSFFSSSCLIPTGFLLPVLCAS